MGLFGILLGLLLRIRLVLSLWSHLVILALVIAQSIDNRFRHRLRRRAVMTFKGWTVAAGLVLLAPCAPHAATEANFGVATTADLVNLCTAAPDNAIGTAAVNFCEGFAQGAVLVECRTWLHSADPSCSACPILRRLATKR